MWCELYQTFDNKITEPQNYVMQHENSYLMGLETLKIGKNLKEKYNFLYLVSWNIYHFKT